MKRAWIILIALGVGGAAALAAGPPLTVDDVVKLVQNGVGDAVVEAQIEQTNSFFSLSTDDLIKLKNAKVSDALVGFMITRKPGTAPAAVTPDEGKTPAAAGTGITIGTPEGAGVNAAGRAPTDNGETTPEPPKFVDLTVNVAGKYVVTSGADLNVLYAAFVDGEKKYYRDQWTNIMTITTAETGVSNTKRILEPGSFTVKVPAGTHTLELAVATSSGTVDDAAAKAHVVYTKSLAVVAGTPTVLNLTGETDADGNFVIR